MPPTITQNKNDPARVVREAVVRYIRRDLFAYLVARRQTSTSDTVAA